LRNLFGLGGKNKLYEKKKNNVHYFSKHKFQLFLFNTKMFFSSQQMIKESRKRVLFT
jgi:hypothetical protein